LAVRPNSYTIRVAFRRAAQIQYINDKSQQTCDEAKKYAESLAIPDNLIAQITDELDTDPSRSWDQAIAQGLPPITDNDKVKP